MGEALTEEPFDTQDISDLLLAYNITSADAAANTAALIHDGKLGLRFFTEGGDNILSLREALEIHRRGEGFSLVQAETYTPE